MIMEAVTCSRHQSGKSETDLETFRSQGMKSARDTARCCGYYLFASIATRDLSGGSRKASTRPTMSSDLPAPLFPVYVAVAEEEPAQARVDAAKTVIARL